MPVSAKGGAPPEVEVRLAVRAVPPAGVAGALWAGGTVAPDAVVDDPPAGEACIVDPPSGAGAGEVADEVLSDVGSTADPPGVVVGVPAPEVVESTDAAQVLFVIVLVSRVTAPF